MEAGLNNFAVFFDLEKAFDSALHTVPLNKLLDSGLCSYLLKWISSYVYIGVGAGMAGPV